MGIQTLAGNVDASGWALSRGTKELGTEAAVRSRVQAGQALVSSVAKCDAELASSSIGPTPLDAPRITVNPADAMQPMPPAYAMQDAIAREAAAVERMEQLRDARDAETALAAAMHAECWSEERQRKVRRLVSEPAP